MRKLDEQSIVGKRFKRMTVVSFSHRIPKRLFFNCICDCGNIITIEYQELKKQESCGCFRKETAGAQARTHGLSGTREHRAWKAMKQRCCNPNYKDHEIYYDKGITVCNEWINDFVRFKEDMGVCPPDYSLDRIDGSKGYSKDNCRWASATTQSQNTDRNHYVTVAGESVLLADFCRITDRNASTILHHLDRGKTPDEIIFYLKSKQGSRKFSPFVRNA